MVLFLYNISLRLLASLMSQCWIHISSYQSPKVQNASDTVIMLLMLHSMVQYKITKDTFWDRKYIVTRHNNLIIIWISCYLYRIPM